MSNIVLILLSVLLFLRIQRTASKNFMKLEQDYAQLRNRYNRLSQVNKELEQENSILDTIASETIELFDITREVCKYLDEDKLFASFKEGLTKYIHVSGCEFVKEKADLDKYPNCLVLPVRIKMDSEPLGYLLAGGVRDEDVNKFQILADQFILGFKRVLLYKKVQELSITDSLTNIFTRRYFLERFQEEIERSKKFNYTFSFLMLDIDYFKNYNDRFGHLVGDTILRELSKVVKDNIRQIDLLGRYGGEEFSILLPQTNKDEAFFVAERIREAVAAKNIKAYDEDLKITVSIGISTYPTDSKVEARLIEKADEALYRAKNTGRNKICFYMNK